MATAQTNKSTDALAELAIPPGVTPAAAHPAITTTNDLANPPNATLPEVVTSSMRAGLSGETVQIVLAAGEGAAGKEAQFVRVNEHTWLVPRNSPQIIPVEAYHALNDTTPPLAEGSRGVDFSPRFSVSVMKTFPAPQLAA